MKTTAGAWVASHPAEIIVCNQDGTILEMNDVATGIYKAQGGPAMIGQNVFEHHTEPHRTRMISVVEQRRHVIYTTEKGGLKKLVSIAPWYQNTEYAGFALVVLDLPEKIPNIVKD